MFFKMLWDFQFLIHLSSPSPLPRGSVFSFRCSSTKQQQCPASLPHFIMILHSFSFKIQSCKIIQAGRDLWSLSGLKTGLDSKLDQVAEGFVQSSFEYLQEWRLHSLSRKPVAVIALMENNFLFMLDQYFPCGSCDCCLLSSLQFADLSYTEGTKLDTVFQTPFEC